jgi:hypothetical protein
MSRPAEAWTMVRPALSAVIKPPESTRAMSGLSDLMVARKRLSRDSDSFPGKEGHRRGLEHEHGGRFCSGWRVARRRSGDQHRHRGPFPLRPGLDLGEAWLDPQNRAVFSHLRDHRIGAPEGELGRCNEVAAGIEGGREERLFLPHPKGHGLRGHLHLGDGLRRQRRAKPQSRK